MEFISNIRITKGVARYTNQRGARVGLAACSRAIQATDRAAAAHARGDDRMAAFWLEVRRHWRKVAHRNYPAALVRPGLHSGGYVRGGAL